MKLLNEQDFKNYVDKGDLIKYHSFYTRHP